jgi:tetratricopeptide (TPR) repeat protein
MNTISRIITAAVVGFLLVGGGAGCSKQARKARYLSKAEKAFKAEDLQTAEVNYFLAGRYMVALKLEKELPQVYAQLGSIYYLQGLPHKARWWFTNALGSNPDMPEARVKLGNALLAMGYPGNARNEAMRVLQRDSRNQEALLLLADTSVDSNLVAQTSRILDSLPFTSRGALYHLAKGGTYLRQRQLEKAEGEFKDALAMATDQESGQAKAALALMYLARSNFVDAEALYKSAAQSSSPRSGIALKYAEFKLLQGATNETLRIVEDITRKAPDYVPAWAFLAQFYRGTGNYAESVAMVEKILALDRYNPPGLELLGNMALARGDATNALMGFSRLHEVYGTDAPLAIRLKLARAQMLNRDMAGAVAKLGEIVQKSTNYLDPNYASASLLLAEITRRQGNYPAAIGLINQLLAHQTNNIEAFLSLAGAYRAQRKATEELSVYNRMINLWPTNKDLPLLLSTAYAAQKRPADARSAVQQALKIDPGYLPAIEQLIDLDLSEKKGDSAMALARTELEKAPETAAPWLLLGKVYLARATGYGSVGAEANSDAPLKPQLASGPQAQADALEAEKAFLKAISIQPDSRSAYFLLAYLYDAWNKQKEALERLNRAASIRTNDIACHLMIGTIQEEVGDYAAAEKAYQAVLRINPGFSTAVNNLAYLYSERLNQPEKALAMAERARQLMPYDPSTADTLGWVLFKRGDYGRASLLLEEAAARIGNDPEIQFHLGMSRYMLGEEEGARTALEQALRGNRPFIGREEATNRLAVLNLDTRTSDPNSVNRLEKILAERPSDPIALLRLASLYENSGSPGKAAEIYERGLKSNPQNVKFAARLAVLYAGPLKDRTKALNIAKQARNLAPEDADLIHLLGKLVFESGDFKWAASLLEEGARKKPDSPEVGYDLAWANLSLGKTEEAVKTMNKALGSGEKFDRSAEAQRFVAFLEAARSPSSASVSFPQAQNALQSKPDYVPALLVAALASQQAGKHKEAAGFYEKVVAKFPLCSPAIRELAQLYFLPLADDRKAYDFALKAREVSPEDFQVSKILGIVSYRRSDYDRALKVLSEASRKSPDDPEVWFYLGLSQFQRKQMASCKESLQRALSLKLSQPLAAEANRVLSQCK